MLGCCFAGSRYGEPCSSMRCGAFALEELAKQAPCSSQRASLSSARIRCLYYAPNTRPIRALPDSVDLIPSTTSPITRHPNCPQTETRERTRQTPHWYRGLLLIRVIENETRDTWGNLKQDLWALMAVQHRTQHDLITQTSAPTSRVKSVLDALKLKPPKRFLDLPRPAKNYSHYIQPPPHPTNTVRDGANVPHLCLEAVEDGPTCRPQKTAVTSTLHQRPGRATEPASHHDALVALRTAQREHYSDRNRVASCTSIDNATLIRERTGVIYTRRRHKTPLRRARR